MRSALKRHWMKLALLAVLVWFSGRTFRITSENYQLANNGRIARAVIKNLKWESSGHRTPDGYYYTFRIKENYYQGHTFNTEMRPGDSIDIIYLPNRPSVNRPVDFIERNYKMNKTDTSSD